MGKATGYDPCQLAEQWKRRVDREEMQLQFKTSASRPVSELSACDDRLTLLRDHLDSQGSSRRGAGRQELGTGGSCYTASSVRTTGTAQTLSRPGTTGRSSENGMLDLRPPSTAGSGRPKSSVSIPSSLGASDISAQVSLERAKRAEAEAEVERLKSIIRAYELSNSSSP